MNAHQTPGIPFGHFRERLSEFFKNNPDTGYEVTDQVPFITSPWGDRSLKIRLDVEESKLVECLNTVYLPQPLTAIWHRDTKDLEIIWGPVLTDREEIGRTYEFDFKRRKYRCEFGTSSERLLYIAIACRPTGIQTTTGYRNLLELARYYRTREKDPDGSAAKMMVPTSFWIREIEWQETEVLELIRHLNFYSRYFDRRAPRIFIHSDDSSEEIARLPTRYPFDKFPTTILAKELDPYLLSLWEAIISAQDPFRVYI
jgi:hypothetical protein